MSSTEQQEMVAMFQAVTGVQESTCLQFLKSTNWNVERALSSYFDAGMAPPEELQTPSLATSFTTSTTTSSPSLSSSLPSSSSSVAPTPSFICGLYNKRGLSLPSTITTQPQPLAKEEEGDQSPLPLKAININARVMDLVADVELSQRFYNDSEEPIEAVFRFKQDDSIIYAFEAEMDGQKVKGVAKEKSKAEEDYGDSIASGHNAFLLDRDSSDSSFKLSVGNLPPKKEATLIIRYVAELYMEGEAVRFTLPITSLPFYAAKEGEGGSTSDGLVVSVAFEMSSRIVGIEAESGHEVSYELKEEGSEGTGGGKLTYKAEPSSNPGRGMVLLVGLEDPHTPKVTVEIDEENKEEKEAVMLTLYPQIELEEEEVITEMIFVVDRSGSMAGSRMKQTKNALRLFLHSLPLGTLFNIIGFGSTHESMFSSSQEYNDFNLAQAVAYVERMEATLGGTNILPPLQNIFSTPPNTDYPRLLFVLTDGEVDNTEQVISFVRKSASATRVFTFGIGADASPELVRGMAFAGKGEAEFVASGQKLESKVLRQLKRALQPVLKHVRLEWGDLKVKRQTPQALPPIFNGQKLVVYALMEESGQPITEGSLTLKAHTGEKEIEYTMKLGEKEVKQGHVIHRLAACSIIRELDDLLARSSDSAETVKNEIIHLATTYGLVSKYTSFVAVVESEEATGASMKSVDVTSKIISSITSKEEVALLQAPESKVSIRRGLAQGRGRGGRYQPRPTRVEQQSDLFSDVKEALLSRRMELAIPDHSGDSEDELEAEWCSSGDDEDIHPGRVSSPTSSFSPQQCQSISTGVGGGDRGGMYGGMIGGMIGGMGEGMIGGMGGGMGAPSRQSSFYSDPFTTTSYPLSSSATAPAPPAGYAAPAPFGGPPPPPKSNASAQPQVLKRQSIAQDKNMRPLDRFVTLQNANGSWVLDSSFSQSVGISLEDLKSLLPQALQEGGDVGEVIWATVLAIAFLELKFEEEKDEWDLVSGKALRWVKREWKKIGGEEGKGLEEIMQASKKVITDKAQ